MDKSLQTLEWITLNLASLGWIVAAFYDFMPVFVGIIVGLSIAAWNITRIIIMIKKWKYKKWTKKPV